MRKLCGIEYKNFWWYIRTCDPPKISYFEKNRIDTTHIRIVSDPEPENNNFVADITVVVSQLRELQKLEMFKLRGSGNLREKIGKAIIGGLQND